MNKLCGTRSTGCKGKAGKEGGSKQGQTGTDEKTKGRSRGGWGWADGAENGEERRKCGEHRERGERGEQAVEAEKPAGNVYRKCTIQKRLRNRFRSLLSSVPRRQGQPPGYYPIRRAAPQGFRPEPVPESQPGASWRAPRSQGHAPEVPWRPSKFRYCSLRRAPCPWRA